MRAHDEAKHATSASPSAASALSRMLDQRSQLGLDADDTFEVASVTEDEAHTKHVRLSQRHKGVRVLNATAVVHLGADDRVLGRDEGALQRGIRLKTQPTLSEKEAEAVVAKRPEHRHDYLIAPRTELVIQPIQERFVQATGAPSRTGCWS
ncbi:hypothetical protein WME94_30645 [Sorangium sp. So ce429]